MSRSTWHNERSNEVTGAASNEKAAGHRPAPRPGMRPSLSITSGSTFVLDAPEECDCIAPMKTKIVAAFLGLAVLATGCVDTVSGRKTAGVPFIQDKIQARYERPMDEVFQAAKDVVQYNGTLVNESILHGQTNAVNNIAKVLEGKVNQRTVWVRVEQSDPKITDVTVQARTSGGGSDVELSAMIDKQIALKLVH